MHICRRRYAYCSILYSVRIDLIGIRWHLSDINILMLIMSYDPVTKDPEPDIIRTLFCYRRFSKGALKLFIENGYRITVHTLMNADMYTHDMFFYAFLSLLRQKSSRDPFFAELADRFTSYTGNPVVFSIVASFIPVPTPVLNYMNRYLTGLHSFQRKTRHRTTFMKIKK